MPQDDLIDALEDELCDVVGVVEDGNCIDVIQDVEDHDSEDEEMLKTTM